MRKEWRNLFTGADGLIEVSSNSPYLYRLCSDEEETSDGWGKVKEEEESGEVTKGALIVMKEGGESESFSVLRTDEVRNDWIEGTYMHSIIYIRWSLSILVCRAGFLDCKSWGILWKMTTQYKVDDKLQTTRHRKTDVQTMHTFLLQTFCFCQSLYVSAIPQSFFWNILNSSESIFESICAAQGEFASFH